MHRVCTEGCRACKQTNKKVALGHWNLELGIQRWVSAYFPWILGVDSGTKICDALHFKRNSNYSDLGTFSLAEDVI